MLCLLTTLDAQESRIQSRIDASQRTILRGQLPAKARAQYDQGRVAASFPMPAMAIHLKPSAAQTAALQQLLAEQQDPTSPNYHKWLTPEQYAESFGASQADVDTVKAWLESQGFTVGQVARARNWIEFSGTAAQVQSAFGAEIHQYNTGSGIQFSNATAISIPTALAGIVSSVSGLNNFHLKPRLKKGPTPETTGTRGTHSIAPDDLATIYDIAPLYKAGVDGTGQTIAVVGQTDIYTSDIQAFRTKFNLPAINLQQVLVPGHPDPGISQNDLGEADLDIEWAGAVARNATIVFVYSDDVYASLYYAVDQNVAPVVTMSYGGCETEDIVDLPTLQAAARQANAQGITWLNAAGDSGAADCDDGGTVAENGLAVDAPASIPEVTGMGGSEFNDLGGSYWASGNTVNDASALSYIPERVWNDTAADGSLSAGGGGASLFFPQPAWQTGPGVPNDGARHVPDLSLTASVDHDPYYIYTGGEFGPVGGTSAAAPTMAGIIVLLNQYLVSTGAQKQPGVGNINPVLYRLAEKSSSVFHDITAGNNAVPCAAGSYGCTSSPIGFNAGPGYDEASGLGSPDAYNLIHQWSTAPVVNSAVVPSIDQNPVFQQSGGNWTFTLTLGEEAGVGTTLTSFTINGKSYDIVATFGSTAIPPDGSVSSTNLSLTGLTVPATVVFAFAGVDASGRQWSQQFSVPFQGQQVPLVVGGASNAASGQQSYAPGEIVSVYGTSLGDFAQAAVAIPLPDYLAGFEATVNNVPAPLYYVSPNQVNLQIPYEISPGTATLTVGNPYVNVNYTLQIRANAPGIFQSNGFITAPFSSASRGQVTTLFITGEGQVRPSLDDGDTPPPGTYSKPVAAVSMTVGGQPVTTTATSGWFVGIPSGLVGVTQINFQVPSTVALGTQPVVVTVGSVSSPPVNLTVTQ
jgi:uncharacterized protein (TIGR03437 family)